MIDFQIYQTLMYQSARCYNAMNQSTQYFYSHLQVNTDVVFPQIFFADVDDAEQFATYQFR